MELMKFTASEDCRIVSPDGGYTMVFKAGQTRPVPKPLFGVAVATGLVPADPETKLPEAPEEPAKPRDVGEDEKKEVLKRVAKELIAKGLPEDFTVTGKLRTASVRKQVDFDFTARDVQDAYDEALHEVRTGGDSDEKSDQSSSNAAE